MATSTRWWSKARGLPVDVYRGWRDAMAGLPGRSDRILAWARSAAELDPARSAAELDPARSAAELDPARSPAGLDPARSAVEFDPATSTGGYVIGSPALLSYDRGEGWQHVGWHEIERGGWEVADSMLGWTTYDANVEMLTLTEPGRLPELFRERVAASIVVERFVPVPGSRPDSGRGVVVNGRRNLADVGEPISWHASLGSGASWALPGLREAADAAIHTLRAEYDPAGPG